MNRLIALLASVLLLLGAGPALAQSTAAQTLPGLLTTVGCPSGYTVCYVPYSVTNPLPVSASITVSSADVNIVKVNGTTALAGAGATGAGSLRVTVAQDTTTVAGSAPGTAGTPSANVLSVQGASGGTPVPVGGYEFNATVIPTVQNAAYAAGQAIGGLQTMSVGSTNGLSGILDQVQVASKGGSVVAVVVYVWSKNPTGTTCTDKTNFVGSQTDNGFLVAAPFLITPALAVSAQDTTTYGSATNLVGNFINGSSNTNLYACVLANAAVTPASTTDYRLNLQGVKDQP